MPVLLVLLVSDFDSDLDSDLLGLGGLRLGRGVRRGRLALALGALLATVPGTRPGIVGHVPARPLQLEAGTRDQPRHLPPARRAPLERGLRDPLHLLEVTAFFAAVLVDRHVGATLCTAPGLVNGAEPRPHGLRREATHADALLATARARVERQVGRFGNPGRRRGRPEPRGSRPLPPAEPGHAR